MRVVLDTNVLISAFANPNGAPGKIYYAWTKEKFELIISEYILSEFRVIAVKKLKFRYAEVTEVLDLFHHLAVNVEPIDISIAEVDENDLPIFGTAISGRANVIVSGDKKVLKVNKFMGIAVVNPANFLRQIE